MEFISNQETYSAPLSAAETVELDLYDELQAFVLSPEQKGPASEAQQDPAEREATGSSSGYEFVPVSMAALSPDLAATSLDEAESEQVTLEAEPANDSDYSTELGADNATGQAVDTSSAAGRPADSDGQSFIFTGALTKGVCLACGAEAGVELFCVECGIFTDGIGSALPPRPTCGDCASDILADEMFCPLCGAVVPSS